MNQLRGFETLKISVQVKAGAKENRLEDLGGGSYRVRVKVHPVEGRANEAVIRLIAEYFDVPRSRITLNSGQTAKIKIFVIG